MALRANSISEIIAPCEVYEIQLDLVRKSCAVKFCLEARKTEIRKEGDENSCL